MNQGTADSFFLFCVCMAYACVYTCVMVVCVETQSDAGKSSSVSFLFIYREKVSH